MKTKIVLWINKMKTNKSITNKSKSNRDFFEGIKDGLPIGLGYLSVSFAFGIYAFSYGLSVFEALLISMTNLTSAGQLAGVPIIASGGSFFELASSQLVINMRYSLMSVSLSQKLDEKVSFLQRLLIAFGNTDEVFAVASSKKTKLSSSYFFGLILLPFICWSSGTLLGALAGDILPESVNSALGIAIYGMFIAIIVPASRDDRHTLACVMISVIISCIFKYIEFLSNLSSGFVIIICAITASTLMAFLAPRTFENDEKKTKEGKI